MSKSIQTEGIILSRTNFGEADRILTFITPDHGKLKAIAKAVRKSQSKLAGGIELFSISHLTLIEGKKDISTVISTRLKKHFPNIVADIDRTTAGYEFMNLVNKNTEDAADDGYFQLLSKAFEALNDSSIETNLTNLWFEMQLLKLMGHEPNLKSDVKGNKLTESASYDFTHEGMHFVPKSSNDGQFNSKHIKFLRLGFAAAGPGVLQRVQNGRAVAEPIDRLVHSMLKSLVRT